MSQSKSTVVMIPDMIQGSGDKPDLYSGNLIHIKEPENLNIDPTCFRGVVGLDGDVTQDNRTIIDFEVNPGFFYIGDKEYYLHSQKVTEVVEVDLTESDPKIILKDYPNGHSHIGLFGPFDLEDFGGVYLDELITNKKVMYSKYLNEAGPLYRFAETGYDICFDSSGMYPLSVPPEIPISQCFTYWEPLRISNPLDPSTYIYDIFHNQLRLTTLPVKPLYSFETPIPEFVDKKYFIVEYERSALKALTGDNFNPMSRITRPGFLVLNPDLDPKIPDRVRIVDQSNRTAGGMTTVVFEIYNFRNNLIKNLTIDAWITRSFTDNLNLPVDVVVGEYNEYYTQYNLLNPSPSERFLFENGFLLNSIAANQDKVILKTEGLISGSSNGPFDYSTRCTVNKDGIGILYFMSPLIPAREQDVQISFGLNGTTLQTFNIRNFNKVDGKLFLFSEVSNFIFSTHDVRTGPDGETYILVDGVSSTLNLEIFTASDFVESQVLGRTPRSITIRDISIQGSMLRLDFVLAGADIGQNIMILKQIDLGKNFITLDSSSIYGF